MFVTLDGPNGVGKTTVSQALGARLRAQGTAVTVVRQPSDFSVGQYVRKSEQVLRGMPLAVLVVADRLFQLEHEIEPALDAGTIVICDRYVASTLVLQRIDGVDPAVLRDMNASARVPDLSIVLSASATTLYERMNKRGRVTRFDRLDNIAELESRYYEDAIETTRQGGFPVRRLDTDHRTISEVVEMVHELMIHVRVASSSRITP